MTPEERDAILDTARHVGYNYAAISRELGIPFQRLHHIIKSYLGDEWREGRRAFLAAQGPESKPSKQFVDILRTSPPRFADPIKPGKGKKGKWKTCVAYGDSHEPYADEAAMACVRGVIRDVKPQLIVHIGDLLDCYTISAFQTDPARKQSLQDDIDRAALHLHQTAQCAPDAERILIEGNHEDRLRKVVWNLQGAARELPRLRVFQQSMTWPVLLGLDQIGWEYVPYRQQPLIGRLSKLVLKHGTVVRKWSGWSAKGEWERHAKGGISGHTHRLGSFIHRDLNGSHGWWESGCTCTLNPEYMQHPDWHHGLLVITYSDDWYCVEPVYIENGWTFWRGKEFAA